MGWVAELEGEDGGWWMVDVEGDCFGHWGGRGVVFMA